MATSNVATKAANATYVYFVSFTLWTRDNRQQYRHLVNIRNVVIFPAVFEKYKHKICQTYEIENARNCGLTRWILFL